MPAVRPVQRPAKPAPPKSTQRPRGEPRVVRSTQRAQRPQSGPSKGSGLFVGLDPSITKYGVGWYDRALGVGDAVVVKSNPGPWLDRALRLHDDLVVVLKSIAARGNVVHIAIEDYARAARNGREESGGARWITYMALAQVFGVTEAVGYPTVVATTALKKFVTGSGAAGVGKEQVMLHAFKRWGVDYADNNQCDAYCLARVAEGMEHPDLLLEFQRAVVANAHRQDSFDPSRLK